jgi:hypothetical protein
MFAVRLENLELVFFLPVIGIPLAVFSLALVVLLADMFAGPKDDRMN